MALQIKKGKPIGLTTAPAWIIVIMSLRREGQKGYDGYGYFYRRLEQKA
jgi:hypothetical protein